MRSQGPADPLNAVWNAESGTDAAVKAGQVLRWRACRSLWAAGRFREGKSFGRCRCRNRPVQRSRLTDGLRTRGKRNADPNREALGAIPVLSLFWAGFARFMDRAPPVCVPNCRRLRRGHRVSAEPRRRVRPWAFVYAALILSRGMVLPLRRVRCVGAKCRRNASAWKAEKPRRRSEGRPAPDRAARSRPEPGSPPPRR